MKKYVLALMLCGIAQPANQVGSPEYVHDLLEFNLAYGDFTRALLGCPKQATKTDECDPRRGSIDYRAYLRAAKLAKRIFE